MKRVPERLHVMAPASSANLGPGFDCLGLALELPFEVATADALGESVERYLRLAATHPAAVAYREAGGDPATELLWRSPIPPGRGLGFSGAARVAGAYLGLLSVGQNDEAAVERAYGIASRLEGHGDNAAASAYGGLCVAAPTGAIRAQVAPHLIESLCVVVWSPDEGTSTKAARTTLPEHVDMETAVRSIAGTATWVAAMGAGRLDLLREACVDRLHQPARLAGRPDSAEVLDELLSQHTVLAAWLSGSGPSVAAMVRSGDAQALTAAVVARVGGAEKRQTGEDLPAGRLRTLRVAEHGVRAILD